MTTLIRIGSPGLFDPTFVLDKHYHKLLSEPLYSISWRDSGAPVCGIGSFSDPIAAENYVKENREKLIDKEFENTFLR